MKQFFATIPTQSATKVKYDTDFNSYVFSSHFPSIPMIDVNLKKGDEYSITVIWTEDGEAKKNIEVFKQELAEMSAHKGFTIEVTNYIQVPCEESRSKHITFFRELCSSFKPNSDVFMDVTLGTKATSISSFASLTYAEDVMNCDIHSIIYAKHNSKQETETLYDIRALHELSGLIHSASAMPGIDIDKILDMFTKDE